MQLIFFYDVMLNCFFITFADRFGALPEWPNGADCKSADLFLRWFESITPHSKAGVAQLVERQPSKL